LRIGCPLPDLAEKLGSGVRMAVGVMLFRVGVKGCIVCGRGEAALRIFLGIVVNGLVNSAIEEENMVNVNIDKTIVYGANQK
jgi:hypothetical protein